MVAANLWPVTLQQTCRRIPPIIWPPPTLGCSPVQGGRCERKLLDAGANGRNTHLSLAPGYEPHLSVRGLSWQMVFARLVTHYWGHGCFLADNEVPANMACIADIPATLIHGLYDISGPLDTTWDLHKAWPANRLLVVDDAGHFGGSMGEQFTAAIDAMADYVRPARKRVSHTRFRQWC